VDEVADGADWRPPRTYDAVVSTEVLEHAPRWRDVVRNAWAAVADGGTCIITCATEPRAPHSAVDGWDLREDEWYANVDAHDMVALVRELGSRSWIVEVARDRGDLYVRADKR
jgi:2-polyprenyl-3-methyl-5-hydroxy-6-metoxy-1,4-benzoquinol methylase